MTRPGIEPQSSGPLANIQIITYKIEEKRGRVVRGRKMSDDKIPEGAVGFMPWSEEVIQSKPEMPKRKLHK